ncbi:hemin uptake protein HemP [Poseidonocella sp. HB161398]|nr:hemin uptake protein HemP [Poseidonocella sp. HB161398]
MPPLYDARALTDGGQIALLELDGQIYTLRITRSSKLILTK